MKRRKSLFLLCANEKKQLAEAQEKATTAASASPRWQELWIGISRPPSLAWLFVLHQVGQYLSADFHRIFTGVTQQLSRFLDRCRPGVRVAVLGPVISQVLHNNFMSILSRWNLQDLILC
ncbi:unnamed protein product [Lactuca virosa]|uniref:Uncharacterized protein n=1 Tax=Lactuca virosa TaxID=75947 RepID=A0AAU9LK56_9ASTR|nr:unnamed protein product [Lactuca virosa]